MRGPRTNCLSGSFINRSGVVNFGSACEHKGLVEPGHGDRSPNETKDDYSYNAFQERVMLGALMPSARIPRALKSLRVGQ